ncbi:class I SAM-dependent methyltransferase [Haliea sp. E17]|uniref:class I SAM-dependent methyltransferase n=1 Tax=Haliea sp. E17 TaxID=3401576 RepID=UPI003AAF31FB
MNDAHPLNAETSALLQQAQSLIVEERFSEAAPLAAQALAAEPANPECIGAMAQAMMPGAGYKQVLRRLHAQLQPQTYVEIGVSKGMSMALAGAQTNAVGIDPAFRIEADIAARARLFPCTSDHFFERYDLFEELRSERLDLAFIDGLHLFEQALKDFVNIERFANPATVVLIHDCFPVSELTARRERETNFWSGDVWKIVPCLLRERPDLQVRVIPCRPCGLALVTGLDPASSHLRDNLAAIIDQYRELPYSDIPSERDTYFSLVDNNWDAISALLPRAA